jgi:hypothetical protein
MRINHPKALIVELAVAVAILDSSEAYIYGRTYNRFEGAYTRETVAILRQASEAVRIQLTRLLGGQLTSLRESNKY